jgi:CDP-diacylglycerol---glycerol-3-phosphate 3-phosphatidyltransferase
MTLATKVTLLRVILIPMFMIAFLWRDGSDLRDDWGKVAATVFFIVAAITDYYDGMLARWYREETRLGKFIDPIADKLLVTTALVMLVEQRAITNVPGWTAAVIIAREFVVTGLRMIAAPRGQIIEVTNAAKWKTAGQLVGVITALVFVSAEVIIRSFDLSHPGIEVFRSNRCWVVQTLMVVAVLVTVYTGYDYVRTNWHLVDDEPHS